MLCTVTGSRPLLKRHMVRACSPGLLASMPIPGRRRPRSTKPVDFLVYDKVMWDHDRVHGALVAPVLQELKKRNFSYETIRYGAYNSSDFRSALSRARAMLFLCEHETQGLAYQEAMSCNVPILAWDPGQWLDPWRFRYGEGFVPATSVPFFDERCGMTFKHALDFPSVLDEFVEQLSAAAFFPRDYVLEHLTLAGCARNYLHLLQQIHVRARPKQRSARRQRIRCI